MPLSQSELQDKLRRGLGNPSLTVLSEDQARDAVDSAVKEYSKNRSIEILDFFGTIKDKAVYDLSDKTGIMRVKDVFYSASQDYVFEGLQPDYSMLGRLEGISLFENPSIWMQYMQRLESYKRIFDGDFEYDRANKMLRLIPPPMTTGRKVFFIWTKRHTVETIPEDDEDLLLLWAKGEAKEMMASRKGNEIQSVSGYGESVSFGATAESLMKEAQDFKDRFDNRIGKKKSIITTG